MWTTRGLVGAVLIAGCAARAPVARPAPRAAPVVMASARSAAWLQGRIGGDQVRAASGCVAAVATGLAVFAFERWIGISTLVVIAPRGAEVVCPARGRHAALIW